MAAVPPMATLRRLLRRGCRRQLVPCYLVVWWWLLYCITILEWRKLLNVEIFGVEVRDAVRRVSAAVVPVVIGTACGYGSCGQRSLWSSCTAACAPVWLRRADCTRFGPPVQLAVPHVDDLILAERLVRAAPPPPPSLPDAEAAGSIAFLFLVKDKLDYAKVWQRFFHGADPAHYGIYFHFFDMRYASSPTGVAGVVCALPS